MQIEPKVEYEQPSSSSFAFQGISLVCREGSCTASTDPCWCSSAKAVTDWTGPSILRSALHQHSFCSLGYCFFPIVMKRGNVTEEFPNPGLYSPSAALLQYHNFTPWQQSGRVAIQKSRLVHSNTWHIVNTRTLSACWHILQSAISCTSALLWWGPINSVLYNNFILEYPLVPI